jgi:hypothetical protein
MAGCERPRRAAYYPVVDRDVISRRQAMFAWAGGAPRYTNSIHGSTYDTIGPSMQRKLVTYGAIE